MLETEPLVQSERQATELLQVYQAGLVERVQGSWGLGNFLRDTLYQRQMRKMR